MSTIKSGKSQKSRESSPTEQRQHVDDVG